MTLLRSRVGDIDLEVSLYRDGQRIENSNGKWDLKEYVRTFEIFESINSATIEASLIIEDSGGLIGALTGSEMFKLQIKGTVYDRVYNLRSYNIRARSRTNQSNDIYIVDLVSDEFIKNEVLNVFGNSNVIFGGQTDTANVVTKLLKDARFLNSGKRLFIEETLNSHSFIASNWRIFDTIYWMSQRSIRKSQSGTNLQNGYAFYENSMGYHFKSIDQMIEDINQQSFSDSTNFTTGKVKLYNYEYSPKNVGNMGKDQFKITSIVFPEERNFLMGLRHGAWSGFSIGFDPSTISESKIGGSKDMSVDAYRYNITELWSKMSHLKGSKDTNPVENMDKNIQSIINYPRRVRYTILPNQVFDPKYQNNPQKNYEQIVELQAYQWMRFESIKNIRLQIEIPGNLDLYVGSGIEIQIPATFKTGDNTKTDKRYSGRYMIAALTHKGSPTNMVTELLLMKDSTI